MKGVIRTFVKEVRNAMDPVGAMWQERTERLQVQRDDAREEVETLLVQLDQLDRYFTSGNDVPVERATILAKDYWQIRGKQAI